VTAKALAAIAAAIVIAALPLPATVAAAPTRRGGGRHNPTIFESFRVQASNGYKVAVTLRNRSALTVSASLVDRPSIVATEYKLRVQDAPGSEQIKASLGKLGRIDMHFVPETAFEEELLHPACEGEMEAVEEGRWVGQFDFRGEHGYTQTRVARAPGSVGITPAATCRHRPIGHAPHKRGPRARENPTGQALAALAKAAEPAKPAAEEHLLGLRVNPRNPEVKFEATRLSGPDKNGNEIAFDTFIAAASRKRGRIIEESLVLDLLIQGPYFKVPDLTHPAAEVAIAPPSPFLGKAILSRASAPRAGWDGDLRVELPGFGVVPLTGAGSSATLCADSGCRVNK
jgi:hypothetical protein